MRWTKDELLKVLLDEEQVPFKVLAEAYNRRVAQRRKRHSPGRPKVLLPCRKCGKELGARERRAHKC